MLCSGDETYTAALIAINADARMGDIYDYYLEQLREKVGGDFNHFNDANAPGKYGAWGAQEWTGQVGAPKDVSLLNMISTLAAK